MQLTDFGHCNKSGIKKLPNCDVCIEGKMSKDRNKTLDCKATKILALVHSDLAGPIQPLAKDGYKYVINFIDDYSGLTMLYFLKPKYNTLLAATKPFQQLLVLNRIKHEQSVPYSLYQNGTTERSWQTLFSTARCLLIESKLPKN